MIGDIENGIIKRLVAAGNGAAGVLGYAFDKVETYPDDWQVYWDKKPVLGGRVAWVTFGGWQPVTQTSKGTEVRATFGIIVAAKSLRNQTDTRHGDGPSQPGSLQLAQDVAGLLAGHSVGLSISGFEIGQLVYVNLTDDQRKSGWSMLALQLTTQFRVDAAYFEPDAELIGDFTTFGVKWDLNPKDGAFEAEDVITLQEEA